MLSQIKLGDIAVDVVVKDIKNVHLSVYPPMGRVRISAPKSMSIDTIRVFAIAKLDWIKHQQTKLREQGRETPRDYVDRESHYVWGKRYLLKVIEKDAVPTVELQHGRILLQIRPGTTAEGKKSIMEEWYRKKLKGAITPLIAKWVPLMGVKVERFFVQRMKTKWGGCSPSVRSIRLNTELAKKPPECLEYIVVHEIAHLVERHHNDRFVSIIDKHLPQWRLHLQELNSAPLAHETWSY